MSSDAMTSADKDNAQFDDGEHLSKNQTTPDHNILRLLSISFFETPKKSIKQSNTIKHRTHQAKYDKQIVPP